MDKPKKSPPNKNQCCGLHLGCYEFVEMQKKIKDLEAKLAEIKNQTAIRELEKVKNFLLEKIEEKQSCFDSGNYNDFADGVKTICELMLISIDKQIKELGGVENVF